MTPSQLEHLRLIDAHLGKLLSLAECRTICVDRRGESVNITSCNTNVKSVNGVGKSTVVHGASFVMPTACANGDEKTQKSESSKKQDGLFVGSFQSLGICKTDHAKSASITQKLIEPNSRDENNGLWQDRLQPTNCGAFGNATVESVVIADQPKYDLDLTHETREGLTTLLPEQMGEPTKHSTLSFAAKSVTLQKATDNSLSSCAGNAEAGWRATKAAIKSLLALTYVPQVDASDEYLTCCEHYAKDANDALESILSAWPIEMLTK